MTGKQSPDTPAGSSWLHGSGGGHGESPLSVGRGSSAPSSCRSTRAAYSCVRRVYVRHGTKHVGAPRKSRTSENAVKAKLAGMAHLPHRPGVGELSGSVYNPLGRPPRFKTRPHELGGLGLDERKHSAVWG